MDDITLGEPQENDRPESPEGPIIIRYEPWVSTPTGDDEARFWVVQEDRR